MIQILFISLFTSLAEPDLIQLRKLYYNASSSKKATNQFYNKMIHTDVKTNAVLLAYQGMAYMLRAKYAINPYNKLSHFNKGKGVLEAAVSKAPQNIEIRFMRFSVQTNAPFFLGYTGQTDQDKALILQGWEKTSGRRPKEQDKRVYAGFGLLQQT
jgi:hypothetical protein